MNHDLKTTWANKLAFFLLVALTIFTALAYGAVHQPIIALVYIFTVIMMLLWSYDAFTGGVLRINKSLLQIPLYALFIYGMIQIIPFGSLESAGLSQIPRTISLEPFWTKLTSFHILALGFIFSGFLIFLDSAKRLRKIAVIITIFGFIYAFYAILQSVLSPNKIYGIYETPFAVPFGSFVNRHNFAAYLEMLIAIPLGLVFAGAIPKDKRLLYFTAIGLMGIALLLSGSRGGLVAFLAEIFLLAILTTNTRSYGQIVLKIGLAVLLIVVIIGGSIFIGGESSLTRFADTANSKDVTTNRTHIWSVTLDVIKENPIFGAGIGAFDVAYAKHDTFNGVERVEQAHNDYLQVLADAGIVGLIIGVFFLFQLFQTGRKSVQTQNLFRRGIAVGALAGCFAILVHSIFDFVLHTTAISIMFIFLLALLVRSGDSFPDDIEERIERHKTRKKFRSANVTPIEKGRKSSEKQIEAN
jgi:O-antigen ligase